jgi:hypothetical protein
MEIIKLRNMLYLQRPQTRSLIILSLLLFMASSAFSQKVLHQEEHDFKPYYFGISLGVSKASFHADVNGSFLMQDGDSLLTATPLQNGGFHLGLIATLRVSKRFELRFNPALMFVERNISYQLRYKDQDVGNTMIKKVESVITTFPVHFKFNSDRIGNMRVYLLGGGKFDMDLASNAKARKADDMLKIQRFDFGVEGGLGFNFYFPSFILSPEIKISHGLTDLHQRNDALNYSRVLDRINSRMIVFTLHIEG